MQYFHQQHNGPLVIHNQKIYFEPHMHEEIEIIALFRGSALLFVDGRDYRVGAGDYVMVFPNTIHSYTAETDVDVGKFIFELETVPELQEIFKKSIPVSPVVRGLQAEASGLPSLTLEILSSYAASSPVVQKAYLLLLAGKLLELIEMDEGQKAGNDLIHQIFDYCRANFRSRITQKDVAKALHISESHLSHIFGGKLKINFCHYINLLRVNEACRLLRQSDSSMIEVAEESGFSSLRSFNRVFVENKGVSPKEYRKNPDKAGVDRA